jgi:LuxR family maltose regulon positive regulatory protein
MPRGVRESPTPSSDGAPSTGLTRTKLAPPPARAGHVARPRLEQRLAASSDARLTLIEAPAGYGKSTLAATWAATADGGHAIAWLSLTPSDNDPVLLTRYLIDALRTTNPGVGEHAERLLLVPGGDPLAWMSSLVNDLGNHPAFATLVLDDYQAITEPACHTLVTFLIEQAPPSLHLVVASRTAPPLPIGRLRAAGQLLELRAPDLGFTTSEARQLLVEREGLDLGDAAVTALVERTEGWAAGLYLSALWLRRDGTRAATVEAFAGNHRDVADYLTHAVLDHLDEPTRTFMLETSIAERLTTSLAEAITGRPAAGVLDAIEASNQFLIPLDETRTWFRYHHLFGELLRSELARRINPPAITELHRRASAWHRERGLVSEAVEHALAAGDTDTAVDMICESWLDLGRAGQEATILGWLERFDPRTLDRYPELGIIGGITTGVAGGADEAFRRWLELAEHGRSDRPGGVRVIAGTTSFAAGLSLLRSTFGVRDIGGATIEARRTVELETESRGQFRVPALANLGVLLFLSGDGSGAQRAVTEAIRDPHAQRRPFGFIAAVSISALLAVNEGNGDDAERSARRALDYAAAVGLGGSRHSGLARVALGRAFAAAGRRGAALAEFERGVELLRDGVLPLLHVYALLWAAPAIQAAGDDARAHAYFDEASSLLAGFEDAGTLTALSADVRQRLSLSRRRERRIDATELTVAERAVLRLLPSTKSQRDIAAELSISINTVKTHVSSIYRKLGVSSRDEAVVQAAGREPPET